jgi:hypothetical protein
LRPLRFKCPECKESFGIDTWVHGAGSASVGEVKPADKVQCWGCLAEVRADQIISTSRKFK